MPFFQLNEIDSTNIVEGFDAQFIHTPFATYSYIRVKMGAILPLHAHFQEQVTTVISGKFQLTVEEVDYVLESGSVFVIPQDVPHSGYAISDCYILDVFTPFRADYKAKGGIDISSWGKKSNG